MIADFLFAYWPPIGIVILAAIGSFVWMRRPRIFGTASIEQHSEERTDEGRWPE